MSCTSASVTRKLKQPTSKLVQVGTELSSVGPSR